MNIYYKTATVVKTVSIFRLHYRYIAINRSIGMRGTTMGRVRRAALMILKFYRNLQAVPLFKRTKEDG
jgi:hypothetical protein